MADELQPKQHQDRQPGLEHEMDPLPNYVDPDYKGSGKLQGKKAIITGGDSGIGRSVSLYYAKEGADVAIIYLDEEEDAQKTKELVEQEGQRCLLLPGDVSNAEFCSSAVQKTVEIFGGVDILVNNAGVQYPQSEFLDITNEQMEKTFQTNFFPFFYMAKAAVPHMQEGSTIINTSSINAYVGNASLIDYTATKGAITSFTRALSESLVGKGIRVNGVAPGPIWTPLIPASFNEDKVAKFGSNYPMGRPGEPKEVAPAYVYLASKDSSYVSGQMLHVNGGVVLNG
ncbi:SDR family oxidoreductase [Sediminibacillus halophilus]|uniref:NAD(P)-dependent dehydrogenase, short-chain alcohol dehydrogenase family n=1 Tax=Sediminibacillus halophilus TaxID=482461 RepID=A0A1G9PJ33_9BACI|nr:SDR family oxidoreductase [Sediminibacillus halophilus]SDL98872.1 NAD(P)-dependent dehydrogenase, short-chain alcohol dehydrogenase family [Sediminibacillus halophilus]